MERTSEEIAKLLDFAFGSALTANQIIGKVVSGFVAIEKTETKIDDKITLRSLFTRTNIEKICSNFDSRLITRVINSLFSMGPGRHWPSEIFDISITDAIKHPDFLEVKRWPNCGKNTWPLIYKMFDSVGIDIRR